MVCEALTERSNEELAETNVMNIKKDTEGGPLPKQPRIDTKEDACMVTKVATRENRRKPMDGNMR